MANRKGDDIAKVYELSQFLVSHTAKTTVRIGALERPQKRPVPVFPGARRTVSWLTNAKGQFMKPSLHLKIVIVLGYVALCTMLVLADQQADSPSQGGPAPTALNYE
jgi:hypothetical protein